jgi:hypothetical protein
MIKYNEKSTEIIKKNGGSTCYKKKIQLSIIHINPRRQRKTFSYQGKAHGILSSFHRCILLPFAFRRRACFVTEKDISRVWKELRTWTRKKTWQSNRRLLPSSLCQSESLKLIWFPWNSADLDPNLVTITWTKLVRTPASQQTVDNITASSSIIPAAAIILCLAHLSILNFRQQLIQHKQHQLVRSELGPAAATILFWDNPSNAIVISSNPVYVINVLMTCGIHLCRHIRDYNFFRWHLRDYPFCF